MVILLKLSQNKGERRKEREHILTISKIKSLINRSPYDASILNRCCLYLYIPSEGVSHEMYNE